jgi:putative membrane protein
MSSEHRLHPASVLFTILKQFRAAAVPLLLLLVGMGTREDSWEVWALVFIVPYTGLAIARYLSFRYRYDEHELFIRWGLVFRNERHVPYDRIQNIDAVQNVLHRALGVVEVRLQTASGAEPEATMSVLTLADLEEMRARVFAGRSNTSTAAATAPAARTLLRLGAADLVRYGAIENRGFVVIAAALGLLSEMIRSPRVLEQFVGEEEGRSAMRSMVRLIFADGPSWQAAAYLAAGIVAFLLVSRVFSIAWALVRLHGFTVTEHGPDLRVEYGLLTRVTATIPRRRVQTVTVRQGPLHRLFGYAAVRVATAGGVEGQERAATQREWIAPIIRRDHLPALLASVLPGAGVSRDDWQRVHPRALVRVLRRQIVLALVVAAAPVVSLGSAALWVPAMLIAWAVAAGALYVRRLGWLRSGDLVGLRTGTVTWVETFAPLAKIQVVARHASPFDRRHHMARVRVDTAGGGGFRIDIPYLPEDTADRLHAELSGVAARTAFQW